MTGSRPRHVGHVARHVGVPQYVPQYAACQLAKADRLKLTMFGDA